MRASRKKTTKKSLAQKAKVLKRYSLNNIPLTKIVYATTAINIINIALIMLIQKGLPPEIPLFYGLAKGEDQIATSAELVIPPALSLLIAVVNLVVASFIKSSFLRQVLIITLLAVTLFSLIATIRIVMLVGSF